jgi:peptidyl-prolyl cis-trans isomerase C
MPPSPRKPRASRDTMPLRFRFCAVVAACLLLGGLAVADTAPLARVGSISIDARAFERRAALVATLDWQRLGSTWPERRRRLLDDVLIADALLAEGGATPGPVLPGARDRALSGVLETELAREASVAPRDPAEEQVYRTQHGRELATPRALSIWRILVPSEADARAVIASLNPPTEVAFSRLARDRSIDGATQMRAGNLGRVFADGDTAVPELRVSPHLFAAADRMRDGELVPEPVAEGSAYAVVWRRASHPERALPAADVERLIAARLAEQRLARSSGELIAALRREQLADYHPERLAGYAADFEEPPAAPRWRAAPEPPSAPVRLAPEPTDRGLR